MPTSRNKSVRPSDVTRYSNSACSAPLGVSLRRYAAALALVLASTTAPASVEQASTTGVPGDALNADHDAPGSPQSGLDPDQSRSQDSSLPPGGDEVWNRHTVRRGDTLTGIFRKVGLSVSAALRVAARRQAAPLISLSTGRVMKIRKTGDGRFLGLRYDLGNFEALVVTNTDDNELTIAKQKIPITVRNRYASGRIRQSLFAAGKRAGLNTQLISQMVSIFGWDIDFALDLRRGDQFSLIYEELYADNKRAGTGDIIAAQFVNRGVVYRAVRHIDSSGIAKYYTPDGDSLQATFLRTPVKFGQIASHFNTRRYHPVYKKRRAHRGVDYGAAAGTPVLTTADGRIGFVGRRGGYGKTVIVNHGGTYSTLYGHMSRYARGIHHGLAVKQGQTIGYVGKTGTATGPHLHYEFRVNGVHRNPLTFEMPRSRQIAGEYYAEFRTQAQEWIDKLMAYTDTEVAAN